MKLNISFVNPKFLKLLIGRLRRLLRSAIPISIFVFPLLLSVLGIFNVVQPAFRDHVWAPYLWLAVCFAFAGSIMWHLSSMLRESIRRLRLNGGQRSGPACEEIRTTEQFERKLAALARGSNAIYVLDLVNVTRRSRGLSRFLAECELPTEGYRQISNVRSKAEFHDVLRFARSHRGRGVSIYCVHRDPLFFSSMSFCVVHRNDGYFTFLLRERNGGHMIHATLVRDDRVGKFMHREFKRLCWHLSAKENTLLEDRHVHEECVERLRCTFYGERP